MGSRAVAPVVGKALEAGIVLLYVTVVTAALYGGIVPDYRTAAGAEVGDRVLANAADRVEDAVPATGQNVSARRSVDLPGRIRGEDYVIRVEGDSLVLDHPRAGVGGQVPLVLPPRVDAVTGTWHSERAERVVVRGNESAVTVELRDT